MFKKRPLFIVFEGVEGCGKSYQSKKLFKNLKNNKIKALLTRTRWNKKCRVNQKSHT